MTLGKRIGFPGAAEAAEEEKRKKKKDEEESQRKKAASQLLKPEKASKKLKAGSGETLGNTIGFPGMSYGKGR
jgi:hypothetical protein